MAHVQDSTGATVKIIQMLQHFEHLASILVAAVSLWATDYGMKSIVGEIVRCDPAFSTFLILIFLREKKNIGDKSSV